MNCDRVIDYVMETDGRRFMSFRVRLHLLRCKNCFREVSRFRRAMDFAHSDFLPQAPDLSSLIMASVRAEALGSESEIRGAVSVRNWIIVGLLIAISAAISPIGNDFDWLVRIFGSGLVLPISITLGGVISIYCAYFIGSHLDELAEMFGLGHDV